MAKHKTVTINKCLGNMIWCCPRLRKDGN